MSVQFFSRLGKCGAIAMCVAVILALPGMSGAADSAQGKSMSHADMVKQASQQSATANRIERLDEEHARVPATLQAIEAYASPDGVTVVSTSRDEPGSFTIKPVSLGRAGADSASILSGKVRADKDLVRIIRPGITEELTTSADGVRQDFVVQAAPEGQGELALELSFEGAGLRRKGDGVSVTLASGRELVYHRLLVTDSAGKQLPARFALQGSERLRIVVADAGAIYPVRIDPTVADADWIGIALPDANGVVFAVISDGVNLYVGGAFNIIGGIAASYIAKWDGSNWSALGSGMNTYVQALAWDGTNLYAGGYFATAGGVSANHIAKWDGSSWSALGAGLNSTVYALVWDGTNLYAGGYFTTAGGASANNIAKWDGIGWSTLGTGMNNIIYSLAWDGTTLYAGGDFTTAGGASANYIAKWDGSSWSALGTGMNGTVYALAWDGTNLHAGGWFSEAGGASVNHIAKWDGIGWSALGTGIYGGVIALAWDGTNLHAGGAFNTAGGVSANYIAKWNGSSWSALGNGTNGPVRALAWDGTNLYAGGEFTKAGASDTRVAYFPVNHRVTASAGAGGSISPSTRTVSHEEVTTFTVMPNPHYSITIDSTCGAGLFSGSTYTTASVKNDCEVTASFAIITYALSYTAGPNGSLAGASPQTVIEGADGGAVTATADTGYHFVNWSDGSTANPRTDTNVTGNITVTANFAINIYTLTYSAGANGSLAGASPQTLNHGADGSAVTATADPGYHFVNWSDGSTANPRTDTNVSGNITVTANFAFTVYVLSTNLTNSVAAYFRMDEGSGSTLGDAWSSATGTAVNDPVWTTDVPSSSFGDPHALSFNGAAGQYIDAILDVSETGYAVSLWFKTSEGTGGLLQASNGTVDALSYDRSLFLSGGDLCAYVWPGALTCTVGANYTDGTWHHLVHTFGGGEGGQKIYVDGVLQAGNDVSISLFTEQSHVNIGYTKAYDAFYYTGLLDEIVFFNRALSAGEVAQLAAGAPLLKPQTVAPGETATFTLSPAAGYKAVVSGCGGTLVGNVYTTAPITSDCTVTATYADATPPNAPQVTGVTPTNDTTPKWSWTSGGGDGMGRYRRKLDSGAWVVGTKTSFTPPAPLGDGNHTLSVQERDEAGNWSASGSFTIKVDSGLTAPSKPLNLAATAGSGVALTWIDNANNEQGYKIYRRLKTELTWNLLAAIAADSQAYTDAAAADNFTYEYKVAAYNKSGSASATVAVTTGSLLPPDQLSADVISGTDVTLTWRDNSGSEEGYVVWRRSQSDTGWISLDVLGADSTSFTDSTATVRMLSRYQVCATTAGGGSACSATDSVNGPSQLLATYETGTGVTLSWTDNSGDESGFRVKRRRASDSAWITVGGTGPDGTSYTDNVEDTDITYEYVVQAFNSVAAMNTNVVRIITGTFQPPTNIRIAVVGGTQADITWTDQTTGESGYMILRRNLANDWWNMAQTAGPGATTATDTGLIPGVMYVYQVCATKEAGGEACSGHTGVNGPALTDVAYVPGTGAVLTWTDNSNDEARFRIMRKDNVGGIWTVVAVVPAGTVTYDDATVPAGEVWSYKVCAANTVASSCGNVIQLTTAP